MAHAGGEQQHHGKGDHVGGGVEDQRVDLVTLHRNGDRQCLDEPEQDAADDRAAQRPAAEDHRGDGDEAAAVDHVGLELVDLAEHEEGSAEPGRQPAQVDRLAAPGVDVDARHVDSLGSLADRPRLEPPAGPVHQQPQRRDEGVDEVSGPGAFEQRLTDERQLGEHRDPPHRRPRPWQVDDRVEVGGETEHEDVEGEADDELVGGEAVTEVRLGERHGEPGGATDEDAGDAAPRRPVAPESGAEGAGEEHPLDRDVQRAGPLRHPFARGGEQEHHRQLEGTDVQGVRTEDVTEGIHDVPPSRAAAGAAAAAWPAYAAMLGPRRGTCRRA